MDGVAAMRSVLVADAPMIELVIADSIHAGPLPLGAKLPAISLQSISTTDRNIPAPGANRHVRERVRGMVYARNYPEQKAVKRALKRAAADKIGVDVPGITQVTIHTDSSGPDFTSDDASVWMVPQDFIVTYTEQR